MLGVHFDMVLGCVPLMVRYKCWIRWRPTWRLGPQPTWKRDGSVELPVTRRIMRYHPWWSRSSDDSKWWYRLSDDPDLVIMIHQWWSRSSDDSQWWSKSSDDVPWWSKSIDDIDPKMKITWRWRWLKDSEDLRCRWTEDPANTEKKTSTENCVERVPS